RKASALSQLFLSIAHFLFQSTAKYYELFLIKTPTIFDHITSKFKVQSSRFRVPYSEFKA
ncbi:hypothetical protein, partial [Chryseobacterium hispalense]|uniref:hypothetical protein n=1 Tax=Chryseobacterium hispalense TaxID=1453492 RepID=UPI00391DBC56